MSREATEPMTQVLNGLDSFTSEIWPGPQPDSRTKRPEANRNIVKVDLQLLVETFHPLDGHQRIYQEVSPEFPRVRRYTPAYLPPPWAIEVSASDEMEYFQFYVHPLLTGNFELTIRPHDVRPNDLEKDFEKWPAFTLSNDGHYQQRVRFLHHECRFNGKYVTWFIVCVRGPGSRHWYFDHKSMFCPPPMLPAPAQKQPYEDRVTAEVNALREKVAGFEKQYEARRHAASMEGLGEHYARALAARDKVLAQINGYSIDDQLKEDMRLGVDSKFDTQLKRINDLIDKVQENAFSS